MSATAKILYKVIVFYVNLKPGTKRRNRYRHKANKESHRSIFPHHTWSGRGGGGERVISQERGCRCMWDTENVSHREKFDSRIFPAAFVPQGPNSQSERGGMATGGLPSKRECPLMSLTLGFLLPQWCRMRKKFSGRLKNCLTAPPWFKVLEI